jgi:hypothetical protein
MTAKSSQEFIPIKQVREGVVILKNTELRGVLMVSSINIALKSRDEQEAIIYQFQSFLNSLDFFCQIVVQSRKTNITAYIEKIRGLEENQTNELLRQQTAGYRSFLEDFVSKESIYTKTFFIVVPYSIPGVGNKKDGKMNEEAFQRGKAQLYQRMEFIALGLIRCGLHSAPLTTVELIEVYWSLFHPKSAESGYYPEFPEELTA